MSSATTGIPGEETSLVARLDLEQKVRLLTGRDSWVLYGVGAVGLRPMVLSDGPAGVRGTRFDRDDPSSSLPCGVGLAATWDERLVQEVALALGREARAKGVDVLLGPTVNIVRTPLAGRGFECFSEDPLLTTRMAVAYVRGVQESGVAATAKHYVGNDSETDRRTYDARIAEHVLRELYLPPFEACGAAAEVAPGPRDPIDPALLREVTSRSFVLLTNRGGVLPLAGSELRTIALIGPNATQPVTQGGGSVRVLPVVRPGLADSLRAALESAAAVSVHQGCVTTFTVPAPAEGSLHDVVSGEPGVRLEVRTAGGQVAYDARLATSA